MRAVRCRALKVSRSVGRAVCTPGDAGGSERVSRAVTLSARSEGARVLGNSRRGAWSQMSLDLLIGLRRSSQSRCCKRRERSTSTLSFYRLCMYGVLTTAMSSWWRCLCIQMYQVVVEGCRLGCFHLPGKRLHFDAHLASRSP
jgi:hypothetical protein